MEVNDHCRILSTTTLLSDLGIFNQYQLFRLNQIEFITNEI